MVPFFRSHRFRFIRASVPSTNGGTGDSKPHVSLPRVKEFQAEKSRPDADAALLRVPPIRRRDERRAPATATANILPGGGVTSLVPVSTDPASNVRRSIRQRSRAPLLCVSKQRLGRRSRRRHRHLQFQKLFIVCVQLVRVVRLTVRRRSRRRERFRRRRVRRCRASEVSILLPFARSTAWFSTRLRRRWVHRGRVSRSRCGCAHGGGVGGGGGYRLGIVSRVGGSVRHFMKGGCLRLARVVIVGRHMCVYMDRHTLLEVCVPVLGTIYY